MASTDAIFVVVGAFVAVEKAREEAQRIVAMQRGIENNRSMFQAMEEDAVRGKEERQLADEEFRRLTKQLDERIKDLEAEIKQLNRLVSPLLPLRENRFLNCYCYPLK